MIRDQSKALPDGLTFGEALIAGMEEALAFKRGEVSLRTRHAITAAREATPHSSESDDRSEAQETTTP